MKKAFIGISGICANMGVSFIENLEVYVSIACSIIICIATLIATFKKAKSKTPKEIEIAQNSDAENSDAENKENNICIEQSDNNNINQIELEQQIIQTAHNIQELLNKRKGGGN